MLLQVCQVLYCIFALIDKEDKMENLLTTFVTDLDEVSNLSAEDLFLVSAPSGESLNNSMNWKSCKVSYSTLSSKIAQDI